MSSRLDEISWPVRTERLSIRPAVEEDVDASWRVRRIESVSRWITTAPPTREEFRVYFEDPGRLAKTLVIELDGKPALRGLLPGLDVRHISAASSLEEYLLAHGFRRSA